MIRRLRHKIFGHGQDGHTFQGYYLHNVHFLCSCGVSLRFRLKNFFSFDAMVPGEVGAVPEGTLVSAREAGELNRHGTG